MNFVHSGDHEYEPVGRPLVTVRTMTRISTAPVVRIIDTDVVPVADSDDSIDLRGRFTPGPILEGNDLIVPLDGQIEDSAMETKELAGGGDTSEELESPQQLQDRLEERFLNAATPCTESRTDGEVNTSQVRKIFNCKFKRSFSCKRGFSLLNFERGLKKTMGYLILKLYIVIILY